MLIEQGCIVKSIAGRDQERYFMVLGLQNDFCLLADGKLRKLESPKRKRIKHVQKTNTVLDFSAIKTNHQLRKALAAFRENAEC